MKSHDEIKKGIAWDEVDKALQNVRLDNNDDADVQKPKTPKQIKKGLECCAASYADCHKECPYKLDCDGSQILKDALALIQQLQAQVPHWISVEERVPESDGKYIVCTAKRSVYCTKFKAYGRGGSFKTDINTHVTHWMPLPEPPKEPEA